MTDIYGSIEQYLSLGWTPIELKERSKLPKHANWDKESITPDRKRNLLSTSNLGIALGDRSGGLVDIDADIPEAVVMASKMFSEYPSFGRKTAQYAHRLAICPDAQSTKQFGLNEKEAKALGIQDGEKTMVIELRGNGSQTMFPPSFHPNGEQLGWHHSLPENIPVTSFAELLREVKLCAFLSVILRAYPTQQGTRDEVCMKLSGTLVRAGVDPDEADDLIVYIAEQKGDEEANKRRKSHAAKKRLDANEEVSGLPQLCQILGIEALQETLHKWLYGEKPEASPNPDAVVADLNKRFFVVGDEGGKCRVVSFSTRVFEKGQTREVMVFQSFSDFRNRFMHKQVLVGFNSDGKPIFKPMGELWLNHSDRRQYEQILFCPGSEVPPNIYNLWRGFAYEPNIGSWSKMRRHIKRILAKDDSQAFRYILRWAAWTVQNPAERAEVALVFRGGKGTGKGTFCRWLKLLFGQHGLQIFSSNHISGRFNGHLRDCVLLFADEAIAPNNREAESILKGLLTEPEIPIESKGRDPISMPNHLHVVMASNAEWVIPATADERRFAMFDVSDDVASDRSWFGPLNKEMENGGAEAMLHFLLGLNLGSWHPRQDIPNNKALNDQRIESLRGADSLYFDWLYSSDTCGLPQGEGFFIATTDFAEMAKISVTAAGRYLGSMGFQQERNRRPSGWVSPPLSEARKIWDSQRFQFDWDDTASWSVIPEEPAVF